MMPRLSPPSFLALLRPVAPATPARTLGDGRVTLAAAPDGTARLVAKTIDGRWVADHLCLVEDVDEKLIRALEVRAKKHEEQTLALMR